MSIISSTNSGKLNVPLTAQIMADKKYHKKQPSIIEGIIEFYHPGYFSMRVYFNPLSGTFWTDCLIAGHQGHIIKTCYQLSLFEDYYACLFGDGDTTEAREKIIKEYHLL